MFKSAAPAISVIMPVYNAERYVAEAVESILAQTFTDFEFLIIDDGSSDGSLAILQKYAAQDSRIRLKSRPNTGYVVALNELLADARGEFIARMDADDISFPERFATQLDYLRKNTDCLVLGSWCYFIDPEGDPLMEHAPPISHAAIDVKHLTEPEAVICHPTVLMRRALFDAVGTYDENLFGAEDLDLWLRASEHGVVANLPRVLLQYRFHQNKVGCVHKRCQNRSAYAAIEKARCRRGLEAAFETASEDRHETVNDSLQTWAWWALGAGNIKTARKHAWRAFIKRPWNRGACRLLLCAARGR